MKEIVEILKRKNQKLIPLSKIELEKVKNLVDKPLPKVYLDFLRVMGNGAGDFMRGSAVFYDEVFEFNVGSKELLEENKMDPLPEDAFVFWMHQGYQMAYFILGESDNPEVYYFSEGGATNEFVHKGTFIDYLKIELQVCNLL